MTLRVNLGWGLLAGLALGVAGCATPPAAKPPLIVMTVPPPPPPMPAGGYVGMVIPPKLANGTYGTPNINNTDAAAVWHLRNALNVAALGCNQAGGGIVEPYNAWIIAHAAGLDHYLKIYIQEWQAPGWGDWQRVYDNNQTRIYNFYSQPAMRAAFCVVARGEVAQVGQIADADLPTFARASLLRLDAPFVGFYAAYDDWRDHYDAALARTISVAKPAPVVALDRMPAPVAGAATPAAPTTADAPIAVAAPAPLVALTGGAPVGDAPVAPAP